MATYLVVDDSPTIRLGIAAALRSAAPLGTVEILEADTEQRALEVFMERPVQVVFLDMMLRPGRSCLDVIRAILAARPDARIILTTGLDREHPDVVEAISMGAFGHLRKPVRTSAVRAMLGEVDTEENRVQRLR